MGQEHGMLWNRNMDGTEIDALCVHIFAYTASVHVSQYNMCHSHSTAAATTVLSAAAQWSRSNVRDCKSQANVSYLSFRLCVSYFARIIVILWAYYCLLVYLIQV